MFHVGQQVVCVDVSLAAWIRDFPLVKSRVYTIARIGDFHGMTYFDLEGVRSKPDHPAWRSTRFRPVKTTSIEIFRAMLVTPPKIPVDA